MTADEVDTGIGPVLTFADLRVRWTFIGLMVWGDAERAFKESDKGDKGDDKGDEGQSFDGDAFHWI